MYFIKQIKSNIGSLPFIFWASLCVYILWDTMGDIVHRQVFRLTKFFVQGIFQKRVYLLSNTLQDQQFASPTLVYEVNNKSYIFLPNINVVFKKTLSFKSPQLPESKVKVCWYIIVSSLTVLVCCIIQKTKGSYTTKSINISKNKFSRIFNKNSIT